jgi:hypothetical protein
MAGYDEWSGIFTPQFNTEKMVQGVIERLKQEAEMSANSGPAEE